MKTYICRRGKSDFVCHASTIGDAIIQLWYATGETPRPSYRVHHGRRRQSRIVSSAVAYWLLNQDMQQALSNVLEETSSQKQFNQFCETAVEAAQLLGR